MGDDIVTQIRKVASRGRMDDADVQVVFDAADEIERLRAAGDQLAYHVRAENAKDMYTAVRLWEQARREQ